MTPSSRTLGGLGLLGPVATARCLGSIESAMVFIISTAELGGPPRLSVAGSWLQSVEAPVGQQPKPAPALVNQRLKLTAAPIERGRGVRSVRNSRAAPMLWNRLRCARGGVDRGCPRAASKPPRPRRVGVPNFKERGDCLSRLQYSPASTTGLAPARAIQTVPTPPSVPGRFTPRGAS